MGAFLVPIRKGRHIPLDKPVVFIGRHPDCDVILTRSRKVSRKHCCIAQVDDHYVIRDLGSMNGIRVNGKRVTKDAPLDFGDEVSIGDVRYVMQPNADARAAKKANGKAGTKPKRRAKADKAASPPLDLSQEFPIPIPESSDSFQVESSDPEFPADPDSDADVASLDDPSDSDDVIPLSDSDKFDI